MSLSLRYAFLIGVALIDLFFTSSIASYAQSVNYFYDELNRLTRAAYGDGTIIDYAYDEAGNRLTVNIRHLIPPTTTASPAGGVYNSAQSVTLTCSSPQGAGCDKIYYTTDGTTPTTGSAVHSSSIVIWATTTLKFFAQDLTGVSEAVKSETYTMSPTFSVTSPNGGETWVAGTPQTIRWSYTGSPGSHVKIELLKGGVLNRTITNSALTGSAGNGSYTWRIPSTQTAGSDYQVRVTSTSNSPYTDTSDSNFVVVIP